MVAERPVTVAVGFIPRYASRSQPRRGATIECWMSAQDVRRVSRRSATAEAIRELKLTATHQILAPRGKFQLLR